MKAMRILERDFTLRKSLNVILLYENLSPKFKNELNTPMITI
jgi:hypothetical protein